MKRSKLRRECKRLHRVFLGSVFLFCLNLNWGKMPIITEFVGDENALSAIQLTYAKQVKKEKYLEDEDYQITKDDYKMLFSIRNSQKGLKLKSPFENSKSMEEIKEEYAPADFDKKSKENSAENEAENKEASIAIAQEIARPIVKGIIYGASPKVIFDYQGELILIGENESLAGIYIVSITEDEVYSSEGVIWQKNTL